MLCPAPSLAHLILSILVLVASFSWVVFQFLLSLVQIQWRMAFIVSEEFIIAAFEADSNK